MVMAMRYKQIAFVDLIRYKRLLMTSSNAKRHYKVIVYLFYSSIKAVDIRYYDKIWCKIKIRQAIYFIYMRKYLDTTNYLPPHAIGVMMLDYSRLSDALCTTWVIHILVISPKRFGAKLCTWLARYCVLHLMLC